MFSIGLCIKHPPQSFTAVRCAAPGWNRLVRFNMEHLGEVHLKSCWICAAGLQWKPLGWIKRGQRLKKAFGLSEGRKTFIQNQNLLLIWNNFAEEVESWRHMWPLLHLLSCSPLPPPPHYFTVKMLPPGSLSLFLLICIFTHIVLLVKSSCRSEDTEATSWSIQHSLGRNIFFHPKQWNWISRKLAKDNMN